MRTLTVVLLNKLSGGIDRMIANFLLEIPEGREGQVHVVSRDVSLHFDCVGAKNWTPHRFPSSASGLAWRTEKRILAHLWCQADGGYAVLNPHDRIGLAYCAFVRLLRGSKVRLVPTVHQLAATLPTSWWRRKVFELIEYIGFRSADAIICVSKERRSAVIAFGIRGDKVLVVPNGVDLAFWSRAEERGIAARERYGIARGRTCFCYVGRLSPEKGVQDLVSAFLSSQDRMEGAVLLLAGDGPLRDELEKAAGEAPRGAIRLLGNVSDVRDVYAAADVLVQPSRDEGLSMTVLEGMSCGLPVVATAVGGNPEVVDNTVGLLVPPRNNTALGDALIACCGAPEAVRQKGTAARARIVAHFSAASMARHILEILERIGGETPSSGSDSVAPRP